MTNHRIVHGDCLDEMRRLAAEGLQADSLVTDPPFGWAFMGKRWDYDIPPVEAWQAAMDAMKPGAHALVCCGTRTQHRMAVNLEDAGFEIRDLVLHLHAQGFPKSMDVALALDRRAGVERERVARNPNSRENCGKENSLYEPGTVGKTAWLTEPATDEAKAWQGWGTALKPACEVWTLCRKPLEAKTVTENVQAHGTGALNIDACRIPFEDGRPWETRTARQEKHANTHRKGWNPEAAIASNPKGRYPANVTHDGSAEALQAFPRPELAQRFYFCGKASRKDRDEGLDSLPLKRVWKGKGRAQWTSGNNKYGEVTGPRRNTHPTVKSTELMRWLCRLVTPPGGLVLDPYCGSGSTGKACVLEGFDFLGIEREAHFADIASRRIAHALQQGKLL